MKRLRITHLVSAALLAAITGPLAAQQPATTAFTYQGRLQDGAAPANALYDFQFKLFDALTAGNQVGSTVVVPAVQVTGGLFTVNVDFGAQFNSQARWLHIGIRPAGGGAFTALVPRQPVTAAPQADGLVLPLTGTTTSSSPGISVTETGNNGTGLYGECDNGAFAYGVWGYSTSGYGVVGNASNGGTGGLFTTDSGIAMQASSTSSHGAYGKNGAGSGIPPLYGYGTGVWGDSDNGNGLAGTSGTGFGIYGAVGAATGINPPVGAGIVGDSRNGGGVVGMSVTNVGVYGLHGAYSGVTVPDFAGVRGDSHDAYGVTGTSSIGVGVYGQAASGWGVYGGSNSNYGVYGSSSTSDGVTGLSSVGNGLSGLSSASTVAGAGVLGLAHFYSGYTNTAKPGVWGDTDTGDGVLGSSNAHAYSGVHGVGLGSAYYGVSGLAEASTNAGIGVYGRTESSTDGASGVAGWANAATGATYGVTGHSESPTGYAGYFFGRVTVAGTLSKGGGSFQIDHPLDPENKYLYHSFVESPDMMDIYNGAVTTDARGYATVTMPDWFQALNRDFRYQLTVIDQADTDEFTQAKIVKPVADNQFTLRTSRPGTVVSWQVTGIRHDDFANAHRIPIEEYKPDSDRGLFMYPAEAGQPEERGLGWRTLNRHQHPSPALAGVPATSLTEDSLLGPPQPGATPRTGP